MNDDVLDRICRLEHDVAVLQPCPKPAGPWSSHRWMGNDGQLYCDGCDITLEYPEDEPEGAEG